MSEAASTVDPTARDARLHPRCSFDLHLPDRLADYIPEAQWAVFRAVMQTAERHGLPFALGGGIAVSCYTGMWRPTKDLDLYVLPEQRETMIEATRAAGMTDYYDERPYDRKWIYRAVRDGVIVDVIWALANGSGELDAAWLERASAAVLAGQRVRVLAPVEMIWTKLHVLQRDRCDWPDLLNLLYATAPRLDWARLLDGLPGEERLLAALALVFSWLAPGRARQVPDWVWSRLQIAPPNEAGPVRDDNCIDRLDMRPWFTTLQLGESRGAQPPHS